MGAVVVRTAVVADLDAIRAVFRAASLSNGDRAALLAHTELLVWAGTTIAQGWTRVAVDDDGAVVGFATAVPVDGEWELEDLFVEPGWMRQGVGRRLVEDMAVLAARAGVRMVRVSANPQAMVFYTAVGFVPDGTAQTRFGPVPGCAWMSSTPAGELDSYSCQTPGADSELPRNATARPSSSPGPSRPRYDHPPVRSFPPASVADDLNAAVSTRAWIIGFLAGTVD